MLQLELSDITEKSRVQQTATGSYRFTLTSDKRKGYFLELNMPVKDMLRRLLVESEAKASKAEYFEETLSAIERGTKFDLFVAFLSPEKAGEIGLETAHYLIVSVGDESRMAPNTSTRARGAATRSIRVTTVELTEDQLAETKKECGVPLEPVEVSVGGQVSLLFRLPKNVR